ncbi:MAG: SIMPL domain-containing protein [Hyphomonadaceae bacterium]
MRTLAAATLAALAIATPAIAQSPDKPPMHRFDGTLLTVNAEGETQVAPDIATINIGVVTDGATAAAAVADNSTKMTAVVAALKKAGVADRDIQTSNLSVNPQYQYVEREAPKLTGYQASNQVNVKVRNLKNVGKVVDAVVAVGSNQVNGISFGLDDDAKAMDSARVDAVKKARARAELYAGAAGLKVGRILSISEAGTEPPRPYPVAFARMAAQAAPPPPVAPGELAIAVSVQVVFELN